MPARAQASQALDQCIKGVDGNPDDVIQSCTAAIDSREVTGPNLRAVLNNRGIAYKNKGDNVHAVADFSQAIDLNPNDDKALNNRGALYMNEGDYERAIADYDKAILLVPDYAIAIKTAARLISIKANTIAPFRTTTSLCKSIRATPLRCKRVESSAIF